MSQILALFILLAISIEVNAQFKDFGKGYLIEKCIEPFAIISKDGKSGLWNSYSGQFVTPFDSSFYQFFPYFNSLLKVSTEDSIYCYGLDNEEINFRFSSYGEMNISRDFYGIYFSTIGKAFGIENRVKKRATDPAFYGEFGLEVLDKVIIVNESTSRNVHLSGPLVDESGEPVTVIDTESGIEEYVYPKLEPGVGKGGVRKRYSKEWIIPRQANWIIKNHQGYLVEHTLHGKDSLFENEISAFNLYNHEGKLIFENREEATILKTPKDRNLLVPVYDTDSIYPVFSDSNWIIKHLNYSDFYFHSNGKTGIFRMKTNKILHELVDFVQIPNFVDFPVRTIIDNGKLSFLFLNKSIDVKIEKGLKVELFFVSGARGTYTLRVKNQTYDSVYSFFRKYSNVLDSVTVTLFKRSQLEKAMNPSPGDYRLMVNQNESYSFEFQDLNTCIIQNNWSSFYSAIYPVNNSGVFNFVDNTWTVPPKYNKVIPFQNGYKAFHQNPDAFPYDFEVY